MLPASDRTFHWPDLAVAVDMAQLAVCSGGVLLKKACIFVPQYCEIH